VGVNVDQAMKQINVALQEPDLAKVWAAAQAELIAEGKDPNAMPFEDLLKEAAAREANQLGEPGALSALGELLEACAKQDAAAAAAAPKAPSKAKQLHECVEPGKPLLVTGYGPHPVQLAKESAWKLGKDPEMVECDVLDEALVESIFNATPADGCVVFSELHRCPPEVLAKVAQLMVDPGRTVFVATHGREPLPGLEADKFGHWAKF
jgi:hypothetical protein